MRTKPRSALLLAALLLLPAACSDGDATPDTAESESASPTPTESETENTTPSPTPSASETPEPELPFPDAGTAAGVRLREQSATVRAPEGWQRSPSILASDSTASSGDGDLVTLTDLPVLGGTALPELNHDQLAEITIEGRETMTGGKGRFRRMPDLVVDGVAFVRIVGDEGTGHYVEELVVEHETRTVSLLVRLTQKTHRADPTLTETVINSLTWR